MKSAVIIIDVQRGYFDAKPRPAVIARINMLTLHARKAGVPVISQFEFGAQGWNLEQQLQVEQGGHRIRKTTPDSFLRPELGELLSTLRVSRLIVCGMPCGHYHTTSRRSGV